VKFELTKNKTPYDEQLMLAGAGNTPDDQEQEMEIDIKRVSPLCFMLFLFSNKY